ncbi:MAG: DUF3791 domain-containing protein [Clostridiales bacterium]|nr:DUF3791 domain-containing protein [Clostridiales bacterium]
MRSEQRKTIAYIVACVGEFARATGTSAQEAFCYLEAHGGIDFLIECYDTEHLLSLHDAVEDLITITRRSEGMIA